jgi:hypothetical protein
MRQVINGFKEIQIIIMTFRMIMSVFYMFHDELIDKYGLRSSNEMCSIEALGMFLWMCGAP